jgi:hypothetical protein
MNEVSKFVKWAKEKIAWRGLICHFYIAESQKQYYSRTDFAYFNLFCDSRDWVVKGTTGHGIRSQRGKVHQLPALTVLK